MRRVLQTALCAFSATTAVLGCPAPLSAQGGFREHKAGFGITLGLPASWIADSEQELTALREGSLSRMRSSSLQSLRDFAADNQNALLFRAWDPAFRTTSVSLNVTTATETRRDSYASASPSEIAELVQGLCEIFIPQVRDAGGSGKCLRHEVTTLEDRGALVIYQEAVVERLGLDNRRVVALLPSHGLLFTLSLSVGKSQFDPGVARAILASIRLPSEL